MTIKKTIQVSVFGVLLLSTVALFEDHSLAQAPQASPSAAVSLHLPLIPTSLHKGPQLTAGDIVEMNVELPDQFQGAEPAMAATLATDPVVWGDGRILWFKKNSPKNLVFGLTTYKPGRFTIPSIPLQVSGQDVAATEPQEVEYSPLVKEQQDQKKEKELYAPQKTPLPLLAIIVVCVLSLLLLAAIIYGIYKWRLKAKLRSGSAPVKPVLPPLQEFEQAVQDLDSKGMIGQGRFKPYYFGISDGAKRFLGRSFHFDAEDRTSRELSQELVRFISDETVVHQWAELFDELDVVKFTDQIPDNHRAQALSSRVLQLARSTYLLSPEGQPKVAP